MTFGLILEPNQTVNTFSLGRMIHGLFALHLFESINSMANFVLCALGGGGMVPKTRSY